MAAAAIPIITTLAPVAIPAIVRLVERMVGSKNGQRKQEAAQAITEIVARAATQANQTPMPSSSDIAAMIEAVVAQLNARGELVGENTPLPVPEATLDAGVYVLRGTVTRI